MPWPRRSTLRRCGNIPGDLSSRPASWHSKPGLWHSSLAWSWRRNTPFPRCCSTPFSPCSNRSLFPSPRRHPQKQSREQLRQQRTRVSIGKTWLAPMKKSRLESLTTRFLYRPRAQAQGWLAGASNGNRFLTKPDALEQMQRRRMKIANRLRQKQGMDAGGDFVHRRQEMRQVEVVAGRYRSRRRRPVFLATAVHARKGRSRRATIIRQFRFRAAATSVGGRGRRSGSDGARQAAPTRRQREPDAADQDQDSSAKDAHGS